MGKVVLIAAAVLHTAFMLAELFPLSSPTLLRMVSKKLPNGLGTEIPQGEKWTEDQQTLVATIVRNAGIYNGILAGGLLWTALQQNPDRDLTRVLLAGAAVAGVFGTATLKSPLTALQALLGLIGLALLD